MKIAVSFGIANDDWERAAAWVQEAERLGVDFAWTGESWGYDAATPVAFMAARTSSIGLGTSILQVPARTPANIAMTALSLASMSKDRFFLGLGASGPQVVEGWYGIRFNPALTRVREVVEIVRMVTKGERLVYKGKVYELPLSGGEGKPLRSAAKPRDIPIYLATLTPRSLEMTGEIADGWLASSFMPDHAEAFFQHIRAGAERAGRKLTDIDLQAGGVVAFSDDLEEVIAVRKPGFAFEMGAMGSREHNFYNQAYRRQGYVELAERVQALWLDGRREEAAKLIPDEFVLKSNLLGTEAMVKQRIRVYRDAGVTTLRAQPDGKTFSERVETLGRLVDLVREIDAEPRDSASPSGRS
jgi:F420-dependent oxidoreductase-like protein